MSETTETRGRRGTRNAAALLGLSRATGRHVLKPASKTGAVTLRKARAAIRKVRDDKKP